MTNPFTADSNGERLFIETLIGVLSSRKDDPSKRLEYLLRNCGYLVERKGDCVVLSDNAHCRDFRDLSPWLPFRTSARGDVPMGSRVFAARFRRVLELGPQRFLKRDHGYKFPAGGLDGLVAYLVKALSAVGIITNYSCSWPRRLLAYRPGTWMQQRLDGDPDPTRRDEAKAHRALGGGKWDALCSVQGQCRLGPVLSRGPRRGRPAVSRARIRLARSAGRLLRRWMHEPNSSLLSISC